MQLFFHAVKVRSSAEAGIIRVAESRAEMQRCRLLCIYAAPVCSDRHIFGSAQAILPARSRRQQRPTFIQSIQFTEKNRNRTAIENQVLKIKKYPSAVESQPHERRLVQIEWANKTERILRGKMFHGDDGRCISDLPKSPLCQLEMRAEAFMAGKHFLHRLLQPFHINTGSINRNGNMVGQRIL